MAVNDHETGNHPADEKDARIASLYKQSSRDTPPAYLDRRIAAAARVETRTGKQPQPWWMLWRVPLATAAIAVVSASLIALMLHEDAERIADVTSAPSARSVPTPQPAEERAQTALPDTRMSSEPEKRADVQAQKKPLEAPRVRRELRSERSSAQQPTQDATEIAPAPERPRAAEAPAAPESAPASAAQPGRELQERATELSSTVPVPAAKPPQAPKPAPSPEMRTAPSGMLARPKPAPPAAQRSADALERAPLPTPPLAAETSPAVGPERSPPVAGAQASADISQHVAELEKAPSAAWLERVRVLRREGRAREAETLLTEFRKRYPNEPLPADLQ
jgi:resuscitation-promoting factor RpfA